ncbi:PRD domain-containing protein [Neobacillus sp. NPDC097160]|uniref:PRD domain-containing protein n=1 Tax=Neobacillus sp. NPDC097160 TaxID=3364298 RepID=UPI00380097CC
MDATLKERIDLLHDTNQINDEIYNRLPSLLEEVEEFLHVKLTEENAGSFTSHISVALQRIRDNQPVSEISTELESVIGNNQEYFQFAKELLKNDYTNIEAEAAFITLYFCLLTGKENA